MVPMLSLALCVSSLLLVLACGAHPYEVTLGHMPSMMLSDESTPELYMFDIIDAQSMSSMPVTLTHLRIYDGTVSGEVISSKKGRASIVYTTDDWRTTNEHIALPRSSTSSRFLIDMTALATTDIVTFEFSVFLIEDETQLEFVDDNDGHMYRITIEAIPEFMHRITIEAIPDFPSMHARQKPRSVALDSTSSLLSDTTMANAFIVDSVSTESSLFDSDRSIASYSETTTPSFASGSQPITPSPLLIKPEEDTASVMIPVSRVMLPIDGKKVWWPHVARLDSKPVNAWDSSNSFTFGAGEAKEEGDMEEKQELKMEIASKSRQLSHDNNDFSSLSYKDDSASRMAVQSSMSPLSEDRPGRQLAPVVGPGDGGCHCLPNMPRFPSFMRRKKE